MSPHLSEYYDIKSFSNYNKIYIQLLDYFRPKKHCKYSSIFETSMSLKYGLTSTSEALYLKKCLINKLNYY